MDARTLFRLLDTRQIPGTDEELTALSVRISELVELNGEQWVRANRERLLAEWKLALKQRRHPSRSMEKADMSDEKERVHVIVSGKVQGVFFRAETKQAADKIGVTGWVRNLPDGTVEAVFEGEREAVASAVEWCRKGAPLSRVVDVSVKREPYSGRHRRFEVRY